MKKAVYIILALMLMTGCIGNDAEEVTNREVSYFLHRAGYDPIRGQVTFTELAPRKIEVSIELINTQEGYTFPAHLHFGTIREVGELAFRLEDVDGADGRSVTILENVKLSNDEILTFELIEQINGSVKIHFPGEFFAHKVVAYGNVGGNENYVTDGVAICTGH